MGRGRHLYLSNGARIPIVTCARSRLLLCPGEEEEMVTADDTHLTPGFGPLGRVGERSEPRRA
jgi:hypothetical protein